MQASLKNSQNSSKILGKQGDAITEAKDLMTLPMDEVIGNLQTYELNKSKEQLGKSQ